MTTADWGSPFSPGLARAQFGIAKTHETTNGARALQRQDGFREQWDQNVKKRGTSSAPAAHGPAILPDVSHCTTKPLAAAAQRGQANAEAASSRGARSGRALPVSGTRRAPCSLLAERVDAPDAALSEQTPNPQLVA